MAPGAVDTVSMHTSQETVSLEKQPTKPASRVQPEHEEYQYLDLIRAILDEGEHRPDR